MSEYNQRMLLILRNRGFDDSKIAQMIGASRTTVNQIINGKRSGRNIEPQIRKLAQVMNLADEVEAGNTIIRIPATSIKAPPEPTTLAGKIKEGARETIRALPRMAEAKLITDRNESKEAKKQRQHNTPQLEPPFPKASKVKPGDIVEVDTRTGRPKRKPRNSKSRRQIAQYQAFTEMVRQSMGAEPPQTDTSEELDTEEQGQLVTIKTLPDGRRALGIKQEAQWCVYCQRRPGTMMLQYGQGFICRECSRNHISDPRVYR